MTEQIYKSVFVKYFTKTDINTHLIYMDTTPDEIYFFESVTPLLAVNMTFLKVQDTISL